MKMYPINPDNPAHTNAGSPHLKTGSQERRYRNILKSSDIESMDWSDDAFWLEHYGRVADTTKRTFLDLISSKMAHKPKWYRDSGNRAYGSLGTLVALSDWQDAGKFCECGTRTVKTTIKKGKDKGKEVYHAWRCRRWRLCPCCSYFDKSFEFLKRFSSCFEEKRFLLLTVGYDGHLCYGCEEGEWSCFCGDIWDSTGEAVSYLEESGLVRGTITREELSLMQMYPTVFYPHTHVLLDADPENIEEITRAVEYLVGDKFRDYRLQPNIDCQLIESSERFNNELCYLGKPVDVVSPYRLARGRLVDEADKRAFNAELSLTLELIFAVSVYRKLLQCRGSLHGRSRAFIGVPKKDREKEKDAVVAQLSSNSSQPRPSVEDEIMEAYALGSLSCDVVSD